MSQSIIDQWGQPVRSTRNFNRSAAGNDGTRPSLSTKPDDIEKLIIPQDRKTLLAISRMMVENFGPVKGALRQIGMFSVGNAYRPTVNSQSKPFKTRAEGFIRDEFAPICDIRGDGRDLNSLLYSLSLMLDRDGEAFVLLTEYSNGFPAVQAIPAHRIGDRTNSSTRTVITKGSYRGAYIQDGVVTNRQGTVIAYRFLADDAKNDEDISARSMIHVFDPDFAEGNRAYPTIAHGLNDIRDSLQSHEWERFNMLIRSCIAVVENNLTGTNENLDAQEQFERRENGEVVECARSTSLQEMIPGRIQHFVAGSGSKLELLKHENPGTIYESFNDRIIKMVLAGIPWPVALIWEATGQGTAERRDITQARRSITDRQSVLDPVAKRIVGYAVAKRQKQGLLRESPDWYRWTFSKPPILTIDDGRMSKAALEEWRAGWRSDEEMLAERGHCDHDDFYLEKFRAAARKQKLLEQVEAEEGVKLDPRVAGMFTPNDMGNQDQAQSQQNNNSDNPQP